MTRARAVDAAVRRAWPLFDQLKADRDSAGIGSTLKAIGRQRRFVRRVRKEFTDIKRQFARFGWPIT